MASVTLNPAASADDGHSDGGGEDTTATKLNMQQGPTKGFAHVCFPSVNIPPGSTITKVVVQLRAFGTTQFNHSVGFEDTDDCNDYVTETMAGRSFLAGQYTKNVGQISDGTFMTWDSDADSFPGMESDIQTIIDKPGWASGNSIGMIFRPKSGQTAAAGARSYDFSTAGSQNPTMVITFTPPPAPPSGGPQGITMFQAVSGLI